MKAGYTKILLGINILIIILGCIAFRRIQQDEIVVNEVPLYSWGGDTGERNYVDETFQEGKYWFRIDTGSMEKGIYHMYIAYETDSSANSLGFIPDKDGLGVVVADTLSLDANYRDIDQEIWINKSIDNMNISIDRQNVGYLRIDNVTITRSNVRSFTYLFLRLLFKLLVLDGLYLLVKYREKIREHYKLILGLSCIFMVSSIGVFTNSMIEGHDIWFHLARIEGIKDGLLSGAFPVKIQPNWLNGYGFAVSTMYGELLLYIPGVLRALGMPIQSAYKCFQLIINLLTVLVSYFAFHRISKDKYVGLVASTVYCLSIYRISSIWVASGVGEYSAMLFFPLVILGVWELLITDDATENEKYSWIWLAIGYGGLIQTHILSCEVLTVFVIIVCLLKIRRVFQRETFIALCKAVIAVVITNLWFLVPFLDYFREDFKVFGEKGVEYIQRAGISFYQLLSIVTGGRGTYQRYVPGVQGSVPFSLGMIPIVILLVASVLLMQKEKWEKTQEKRNMAVCFALLVLSAIMSTTVFPWDALTDLNGFLGELILSIRRPTRFMTVTVALVPLLACLVLMKLKETVKTTYVKVLAIGICIICALEGMLFTDFVMRGNSNFTRHDGEHLIWNLAISGQEYFYTGTDCLGALADTEFDSNISVLSVERNYNRFEIVCEADEAGYIDCPIFYYRGYQAMDTATEEYLDVSRGENNKLRISLREGYKGELAVCFKEPWYWRVSELISLMAVLLISGTGIWKIRRKV